MDIDLRDWEPEEGATFVLEGEQDQTPDLVNLQMILITSSLNHEYAIQEFEKAHSYHEKQELLERMSHLKHLYFVARRKLYFYNPDKVEEIERELLVQKQSVFSEYLA